MSIGADSSLGKRRKQSSQRREPPSLGGNTDAGRRVRLSSDRRQDLRSGAGGAASHPSGRIGAMRARQRRPAQRSSLVDFDGINRAALAALPALLARWLPGGKQQGNEYMVRNPKRHDRRPGSFKVNLRTGKWADFATGDQGGDVVSLAAFLGGIGQREAAERLAAMLAIEARRGR